MQCATAGILRAGKCVGGAVQVGNVPQRPLFVPSRLFLLLLGTSFLGAFSIVVVRSAEPVIVGAAVVLGLFLLRPVEAQQFLGALERRWAPVVRGRGLQTVTLLWSIAAIGVALRIRAYAAQRALWLDEAYLARSLLERDLPQLLGEPLAHAQSAPPGFLALSHLAVRLLGFDELSLRLVPFAASVGTLVIAVLLARRVFRTRWASVLFVALLSLSPFLIYYGQELKQYALDAFVSIAVLLIHTSRVLERRPIVAGSASAVLALLSLPGAVLVGVLVAFHVVEAFDTPGRLRAVTATLLAGIGVAAHAAHALVSGLPNRVVMMIYWEGVGAFPPDANAIEQLRWYVERLMEVVWLGLGHSVVALPGTRIATPILVLVVVGFGAFALGARTRVVDMGGAILITVVLLSQARMYPVSGRLALHLIPVLMLLFVVGIERVASRATVPRVVVAVVVAAVLLIPFSESLSRLREPLDTHDLRAAVAFMDRERLPTDLIVMNRSTRTQWSIYADSGLIRSDITIRWVTDSGGRAETLEEVLEEAIATTGGSSVNGRRIWFIAADRDDELQRDMLAAALDSGFHVVCDSREEGLFVGLLSTASDARAPDVEDGSSVRFCAAPE